MHCTIFTGEDFSAPQLTELVFQPEDDILPYSFQLIDDQVIEPTEDFSLVLSINETQQGLQPGTNTSTTVNILDDEGTGRTVYRMCLEGMRLSVQ